MIQDAKYTRLVRLQHIVPVPPFTYIRRGDVFDEKTLPKGERFIVRGVSAHEDGVTSSHAGQFITIGPCDVAAVRDAVAKIFSHPWAIGAIVQVFVDAPSGVAFCFTRERLYVEYAREHEGVTAGTVNPSVALLPSVLQRYNALTRSLQRIYDVFGACDVEFVGIENPSFVQVRPITQLFNVDEDIARCKMMLQEMVPAQWVENDLSETIAERSADAARFWHVYRKAMARFCHEVLHEECVIPHDAVVRIGQQYFVRRDLIQIQTLTFKRMMKFLLYYARYKDVLHDVRACDDAPLDVIIMRNYCIAIAHSLWHTRFFFALRQRYRAVIDVRLRRYTAEKNADVIVTFPLKQALASPLRYNRQRLCWDAFTPRTGAGTAVVEGELSDGPFFCYEPGASIPDDVVVLTLHLYAEIGAALPRIRGVICAHGSLNAHVAILARETRTPLIINAPLERYKKCAFASEAK